MEYSTKWESNNPTENRSLMKMQKLQFKIDFVMKNEKKLGRFNFVIVFGAFMNIYIFMFQNEYLKYYSVKS